MILQANGNTIVQNKAWITFPELLVTSPSRYSSKYTEEYTANNETYSMKWNHSWEDNSRAKRPKLSAFLYPDHISPSSWARWIQSTHPNTTFLRSILILPYHLWSGLPSAFFPSGHSTKNFKHFSYPLWALHAPPISTCFISTNSYKAPNCALYSSLILRDHSC